MINQPISSADFSLGRKLNVNGNGWACFVNTTTAAANGGILVTPGATRGLVVVGYFLDASVAVVYQVAYATGLTGSGAQTPTNMNAGATNTATFTFVSSNTGGLTGVTGIDRIDIPAGVAYPYVDLTDNPIILPAGSATGLGISTVAAVSGALRITMFVQEYPY